MAKIRKQKSSPVRKTVQRQQPPIRVNYLNIERIIDVHECQVVYRVRWPNTWERGENLLGCEALQRFHEGTDDDEDDDDENEVSDFQPGADDNEYEVYKILEKRIVDRKVKYYVKWKDTWENDDEIDPVLIREFNEEQEQQQQLDDDDDEEDEQEEQQSDDDEQSDQEQEEQQQFDSENERDDAEYDLQWVDGGEHQGEEDQQFDSNQNHKATTSKKKRKRRDDTDDANEAKLKSKRSRMVEDDDRKVRSKKKYKH